MRIIGLLFILWFGAGCAQQPPVIQLQSTNRAGPDQAQAVHYLTEIGLGRESGISTQNSPAMAVIKKWNSPVRVQLHGSYTPEDEQELNTILSELAQLTGLSITRTNRGDANINIHFIHQNAFVRVIPGYDPSADQMGVFVIQGNAAHVIEKAAVAVDQNLTGTIRKHILREEVTQSMGLPNDSYQYPNSIFQQSVDYSPTEYAEIDKAVIRLLYDQRIRPGMTQQEVLQALYNNAPPMYVA